ncbi:MAG: polyribonucleotide nucleotidyltransferase, partial [Alphaproteobacteria bacterium]|nr:polyribonucleotide nucleotidyltransferase [Alphaproteobacteria bacterium]
MFKMNKVEIEWGGRTLTLETGQIARQADGAVLATYGETSVLCTVVGNREAKEGLDFFPLTVQYQEKTFAAGKIPGGFFKREGRPSEKEVLTSRLIDRPIRPLFADGFKNETQVICTVLSHDMENNPDVVAMIGASAALTISGLPFLGPIGCARVGYVDGSFVLNPLETIGDGSSLDLVVAGTIDGVLMVESEAHELSEDTMLDAVSFGHDGFQPVIKAIIQLAEKAAKDPWELPAAPAELEDLQKAVEKKATADLKKAYKITEKTERREKISAVKESVLEELGTEENKSLISGCFKEVEKNIVRKELLTTGNRIDGRDTKTVRNIQCDVEILPRAHGSALFTRGETQALVVTTLGTGQDEQIIDALEGEYRQNFLLHYNFPPFSVGETGRFGTPGRREIGHGKLAWRALRPLLPSKEEFPYTIRVVSEITESNGS